MLAGNRYHTFISTIYPLNGKSKLDSTFTFILLLVLLFQMTPNKVYFFLLFTVKVLLFVLLFEIPKKIRSTKVLQASYSNTQALIGIGSSIFGKTKIAAIFWVWSVRKKSELLILPRCTRCVYFAYPDSTIIVVKIHIK